jgi:hypothetical protein
LRREFSDDSVGNTSPIIMDGDFASLQMMCNWNYLNSSDAASYYPIKVKEGFAFFLENMITEERAHATIIIAIINELAISKDWAMGDEIVGPNKFPTSQASM